MSVKSLSVTKRGNTAVTELFSLMKVLHLQYYDPGVGGTFPEKSQEVHSQAFNSTDSLFNSPVCEAVCCFFRSLLAL